MLINHKVIKCNYSEWEAILLIPEGISLIGAMNVILIKENDYIFTKIG
jgi:hypothetical protein